MGRVWLEVLLLVSATFASKFGGATLPEHLYTQWLFGYHLVDPNFAAEYEGVGSSLGFQFVANGTYVFGGSDAEIPEASLKRAGVISIPIVGTTLFVIHNRDLVPSPLNLSVANVADIFLGRVRLWNDSSLVKNNPLLANIPSPITVVARSDGSGTTDIFAREICSSEVKRSNSSICYRKVAKSDFFRDPAAFPATLALREGNDGVACGVASLRFAISYAPSQFAIGPVAPANILRDDGSPSPPPAPMEEFPADAFVDVLPPQAASFQIRLNRSLSNVYPFLGVTNGVFKLSRDGDCDAVERSLSAAPKCTLL
jgi:ABC-type phosphate transport system substrate-binding protein